PSAYSRWISRCPGLPRGVQAPGKGSRSWAPSQAARLATHNKQPTAASPGDTPTRLPLRCAVEADQAELSRVADAVADGVPAREGRVGATVGIPALDGRGPETGAVGTTVEAADDLRPVTKELHAGVGIRAEEAQVVDQIGELPLARPRRRKDAQLTSFQVGRIEQPHAAAHAAAVATERRCV